MDQQQPKRPREGSSSDSPALLRLLKSTKVPSEYICPLSWRIMSDPVLDPDDPEGRAVERKAFEAHQRLYGVRPLTGRPALPHVGTLGALQECIVGFLSDAAAGIPVKRPRLGDLGMDVPAAPPPCTAMATQAAASVSAASLASPQPRPAPAAITARPVLSLGELEVPAPFFCPLSRAVMSDPVVDRRDPGASMERAAVEDHVAQYGNNPLTGEPMTASDLIPDKGLRSAISRWLTKHTGPELRLHTATTNNNNTAPAAPSDGNGVNHVHPPDGTAAVAEAAAARGADAAAATASASVRSQVAAPSAPASAVAAAEPIQRHPGALRASPAAAAAAAEAATLEGAAALTTIAAAGLLSPALAAAAVLGGAPAVYRNVVSEQRAQHRQHKHDAVHYQQQQQHHDQQPQQLPLQSCPLVPQQQQMQGQQQPQQRLQQGPKAQSGKPASLATPPQGGPTAPAIAGVNPTTITTNNCNRTSNTNNAQTRTPPCGDPFTSGAPPHPSMPVGGSLPHPALRPPPPPNPSWRPSPALLQPNSAAPACRISAAPDQPSATGADATPGQAQASGGREQMHVQVKAEVDEEEQGLRHPVGVVSHDGIGTGPLPPGFHTGLAAAPAVAAGGAGGDAGADGKPSVTMLASDTSDGSSSGGAPPAAIGDSGAAAAGCGSSEQTSPLRPPADRDTHVAAAAAADVAAAALAGAGGLGGTALSPGVGRGRGRGCFVNGGRLSLMAAVPLAARATVAAGAKPQATVGQGATAAAVAAAPSRSPAADPGASGSGSGTVKVEGGGGGEAGEMQAAGLQPPQGAQAEGGPAAAGGDGGGRASVYYTDEELEALVAGVEECGSSRWSEVKARKPQLSKRTESALGQKWMSLSKAVGKGWPKYRRMDGKLRARIAALLPPLGSKNTVTAAATADADETQLLLLPAASEPEVAQAGEGLGTGQQELQTAGPEAAAASRARRYSQEEVVALLNGIVKHGCEWETILQENQPVLASRTEASIEAKWESLRIWADEGWCRMQDLHPPAVTVRRMVRAAVSMMAAMQEQHHSFKKHLPLIVPAEVAMGLPKAWAGGKRLTVQVRIDGVPQSRFFGAKLCPGMSWGGLRLQYCKKLRDAIVGKRIEKWSSYSELGLLLEATSELPRGQQAAARADGGDAADGGAGAREASDNDDDDGGGDGGGDGGDVGSGDGESGVSSDDGDGSESDDGSDDSDGGDGDDAA